MLFSLVIVASLRVTHGDKNSFSWLRRSAPVWLSWTMIYHVGNMTGQFRYHHEQWCAIVYNNHVKEQDKAESSHETLKQLPSSHADSESFNCKRVRYITKAREGKRASLKYHASHCYPLRLCPYRFPSATSSRGSSWVPSCRANIVIIKT